MGELHKMTINDMFTTGGKIRSDGLMEHEMYIMQVKRPEESKYPWDYYRLVQPCPANRLSAALPNRHARWRILRQSARPVRSYSRAEGCT
jgi:branched-chain amino acid transport system substrate-binding protein